jgi:poly(hydroxyalkanoate) depolymerase family esterase
MRYIETMKKILRRYEFSERLAEILGESRRDIRYRVTLMVSGGLVAPGPRGPGSPPVTSSYASDLLIGTMAAPQQAHTVEAVRSYRALQPTRLTRQVGGPEIVIGPPTKQLETADIPRAPLFSANQCFGDVLAWLLDQAANTEARKNLAHELFGLWISRGYPVAGIQLGLWSGNRRSLVTQLYEQVEGSRPPSWLNPDGKGLADSGLIHRVFLPVRKLIDIASLISSPKERRKPMRDINLSLSHLINLVKNTRLRPQWEKLLSTYSIAKGWTNKIDSFHTRLFEVTSFGSNPGELRMFTYVPDNLPDSAPLVVLLHGGTQSAASYDQGTGWSTLADRYGFALLLPQQPERNNPLKCFNWFNPEDMTRDSGEALSIKQMVDWMVAEHNLDRQNLYVTGVSSGGAMAAIMLATYPDVFAGGAIIAGLPYRAANDLQEGFASMFQGPNRSGEEWGNLVRSASSHQGQWPKISIWHGDADSTVKPENATEIVKQWANIHRLDETASIQANVNGYLHQVWQNPNGEDLIECYTIAGMGHGVPVNPGNQEHQCGTAAPFFIDMGISSTYHIAKFFGLPEKQPADWEYHPRYSTSSDDAAKETHSDSWQGIGVQSTINKSLKAAEFFKDIGGIMPGLGISKKAGLGVDVSKIITSSLEAAGVLKSQHTGSSGSDRKIGPGSVGIDVASIIANALESAGIMTTPKGKSSDTRTGKGTATVSEIKRIEHQPDASDAGADSVTATGSDWEGAGWQLLTDMGPLGSDSPMLFGCVSSGENNVVGDQIRSVSRQLSLGKMPTLNYARKLELGAAANEYTTARFSVLVNGVIVDQVLAIGMDHTEQEWTKLTDIDLSRFAGQTVTLTFELAANSNLYHKVSAKAWLDCINIKETAASEAA